MFELTSIHKEQTATRGGSCNELFLQELYNGTRRDLGTRVQCGLHVPVLTNNVGTVSSSSSFTYHTKLATLTQVGLWPCQQRGAILIGPSIILPCVSLILLKSVWTWSHERSLGRSYGLPLTLFLPFLFLTLLSFCFFHLQIISLQLCYLVIVLIYVSLCMDNSIPKTILLLIYGPRMQSQYCVAQCYQFPNSNHTFYDSFRVLSFPEIYFSCYKNLEKPVEYIFPYKVLHSYLSVLLLSINTPKL